MKLAFNGDPEFNLKGSGVEQNTVKAAVEQLFKTYADNQGKILIKWDDSKMSTSSDDKGNKIIEFPPAAHFTTEYNYRSNKGDQIGFNTIRIFNASVKEKNNSVRFVPRTYAFNGSVSLSKHDVELVFWLVFVNPHCQVLEDPTCRNYQNVIRKDAIFMVYSTSDVAKRNIKEMEFEAEVKFLITTSNDAIKMNETKIRSLAHAYNIPDAEDLDLNSVKLALIGAVLADKTPKGRSKWASLVHNAQELTRAALIQKAIDNDVVVVRNIGRSRKWHWYNPIKKEYDGVLTIIRSGESDLDAIKKYFSLNPEHYAMLEERIDLVHEGKELPTVEETVEDVE
jgi:hypothetical protein